MQTIALIAHDKKKDEKGKWYATDKMPPNLGIYLRFPDNRSVQERLERIYKEQGLILALLLYIIYKPSRISEDTACFT